jgi:ubiquitin C-terminal hydrolase
MDENPLTNTAGLVNFGNTCFMNASIQLLMCARVLGAFVGFSNKYLSNSDIGKYALTWSDYMNPETKVLGPRIIYHRYMVLNKNYVGFSQEDSHEFLTFTLDDISEQIKSGIASTQAITNKDEVIDELNKIYRIKFSQTVTYTDPSHPEHSKPSESTVYENILTLPINSDSEKLDDCFNLYMNQEEPGFKINFQIVNPPKYIFVGLKRFRASQSHIEKIIKPINVPFETKLFDSDNTYVLKGFIIHVGGIFGGHYYAYGSRKIENQIKWFCFNDSSVGEVSLETVEKEASNAYVFLYGRK